MSSFIQFPAINKIDDKRIADWVELSFIAFYEEQVISRPKGDYLFRAMKRVKWSTEGKDGYCHIAGQAYDLIRESCRAGSSLVRRTAPKGIQIGFGVDAYCSVQSACIPGLIDRAFRLVANAYPEDTRRKRQERNVNTVNSIIRQTCRRAYFDGYQAMYEAAISA